MRSVPRPTCLLCRAPGEPLYQNLNDRLFSATGQWNLVRCSDRGCGLLWLDPMPIEADIADAYRDYHTHAQDSRPRLNDEKRAYLNKRYGYPMPAARRRGTLAALRRALFRLRFRRKAELAAQVFYLPMPAGGGRLLDVGCGSGDGLRLMSELGWTAEGVEVDPQAIAVARSKGLTIHAGTLVAQNFPDMSFDAITMSHVIEHLHDPVAIIAECRRILKPGGTLVMITPNARSLCHAQFGANWVALDPPRHLHIFTPQALQEATRRAGFSHIDVTTSIHGAEWTVLASQMIGRTGRGADLGGHLRIRRRWARAVQAAEALALRFNAAAGEEIVLKARKDG
jgi:2-polyprenyl-3-methyl-5-hydroxy-6-metoxy-1,4-benzoquinol methylase